MDITYTWNIVAMNCKPDVNGMLDYVVTSHWELTATDGTYIGSVYGTASFKVDPDKPNYTPYMDLTLDQVIAWTQASLGAEQVASYETAVADQIQAQINPSIVTPKLPWL
tara:strand:+ start:1171 stop:1500 length:330 start_codon:yes stop_codon:yes gene_type:complete